MDSGQEGGTVDGRLTSGSVGQRAGSEGRDDETTVMMQIYCILNELYSNTNIP